MRKLARQEGHVHIRAGFRVTFNRSMEGSVAWPS
jgi:hypothetical protein